MTASEKRIHDVTKNLISIAKKKRMLVFHTLAKTKVASYTRGFFNVFTNPSSVIGCKIRKPKVFPPIHLKPRYPGSYVFDHTKLRTAEETEEELRKIRAFIDKFVERDMKKFEERKKREAEEKANLRLPPLYEKGSLLRSSSEPLPKRKRLTNEQFLRKLKAKDREKSRYLQALLPVHPDEQKHKILMNFREKNIQFTNLFTPDIYNRTRNLLDEISVLQIESYPSKLINKLIPKIDDKLKFLQQAYKFIIEEQKLWPNISVEVIFMDFLFNPENKVKRDVAVYIICLLLDLQEDYRDNVKRGFLKTILRSEVERDKLQLEIEPPDFPICTLKAPVPWKCAVQLAKNRLEEILMINHPVLQAIQVLWHNLYHDLLIVDTTKFYRGDVPFNAENITEIITNCCKITRDVSKI